MTDYADHHGYTGSCRGYSVTLGQSVPCDCGKPYTGPVPKMPRPADDAPESEWKRYARRWEAIAKRRWMCDCPCYCQDVPAARAGERKDSRDG